MRRINKIEASADAQPGVCGGSAHIIRTRIPVWLLEALRRDSHREQMDREIAANADDSLMNGQVRVG